MTGMVYLVGAGPWDPGDHRQGIKGAEKSGCDHL